MVVFRVTGNSAAPALKSIPARCAARGFLKGSRIWLFAIIENADAGAHIHDAME